MKERSIVVTQGNINNNHLYLRNVLPMFPSGCIGGSNRKEQASQLITLYLQGADTVQCDIDGKKKIFRDRKAIRQFLGNNDIAALDEVLIRKIGLYEYQISKIQ
ncbi:hypothetical protein NX722_09725 [Endozoicomonas gorgoniicola]|uniref:Uncharacterized protein n=1 Tax=Endozoicomonas gorgoniicola TaxID=1234144 RepID=A0ABT3MU63_9GAMM|nr:hypothetical protein [Endozoicomonas gorgoniicola]MCW7552916.1 hypothetical protein [Endozoicomonas gorgoniicola]